MIGSKAFCLIVIIAISILFSSCTTMKPRITEPTPRKGPSAFREFRAAWVATVDNIDWPSKPGLTTEEQKQEAIAILDTAEILNLNAIVFQVRPQCDALYPSQLEPWSYYLTGQQGINPEPYYDPLKFWIEEAHNRGIELHAWFNPYRAHHPKGGNITDYSVVKTHPELVKNLNNGYYWLDPGKQETQDYSFDVVMDVLRRYDIDGIHFDDYFYPYGDGSFPDDDTWRKYQNEGGKLTREDWRRESVNNFIHRLYTSIKKEKSHVKFGLSPFGIWRPRHPESIRGFDQYSILYADARLWLNNGWVDYWTPQLYWPINQISQSYPVLLGWWVGENKQNRNLWPGLFTSRVNEENGFDENINQIMVARGFVPEGPGHVHFSMKALLNNRGGVSDALKSGPYNNQALVPASPWLDSEPPSPPKMDTKIKSKELTINWNHDNPNDVFLWVVYYKLADEWKYKIENRNTRSITIPVIEIKEIKSKGEVENGEEVEMIEQYVTEIAVSAVDRVGNESLLIYQSIKSIPED